MIYLDHAATTPVDPRVRDAMLPFLGGSFGNPSSVHGPGRAVRAAIERAREEVAALVGASPAEIVFTSGGTESDNAAVRLGLAMTDGNRNEIITSPAEHHAVLSACELEAKRGAAIRMLPVNEAAIPDIEAIDAMVGPRTALCTLMHVNNETGGILPLDTAAARLKEHDVLFHTDAVQSAGKLPIDVRRTPVDLLSLSAHKIHGPKGVGALFVRSGHRIESLQHGGGQERGRRGGTENVAGIVGFGAAARLALSEMETRMAHWRSLRDMTERRLAAVFPDIRFNGRSERVLPNILSVSFPASLYPLDGGALLMNCDMAGLAVSGGSACTAGSIEPSHVIRAIGHEDAETAATVRISFGAWTEPLEVDHGLDLLIATVQEMLRRGG
jgi:cysteine desulfurase